MINMFNLFIFLQQTNMFTDYNIDGQILNTNYLICYFHL